MSEKSVKFFLILLKNWMWMQNDFISWNQPKTNLKIEDSCHVMFTKIGELNGSFFYWNR